MNDYSTTVKTLLSDCISDFAQHSWLYVKRPGMDFTRNRKMSFEDTIKFLISMQKTSTKQELLDYFHFDSDAPTQAAFSQQRAKIRPDTFELLFHEFNSRLPHEKNFKGYRLLACDGSAFGIARNPSDTDSYALSDPYGKGFNMIHLNALYDLCNKTFVDAVLQPYCKMNEKRAFCSMIDRYCNSTSEKTIFIADRGYESLNIFAHAMENHSRFMIRAKSAESQRTMLSTFSSEFPDTDEFDIDIKRFLTRRHTKSVKNQPDIYKFIGNRTFDYLDEKSSIPYFMEFRVIRFLLSNGTYEYIITNLPRYEFSIPEIKQLYNMRWGIETSFRDLKYSIGLLGFHAKKYDYIIQEIFAKLIMYNFCESITNHISLGKNTSSKYTFQINCAMAIRICMEFFLRDCNAPPMNVEALIGRHLVPIRPNRKAPRHVHSQSARSFIYR